MPATSLTGRDTITINGRNLADFGDGNVAELTFPNDLVNLKTGKNGNTIYGFNYSGRQCELSLRILRGTADDIFLNSLLLTLKNSPPTFTLITGEFTKVVGDGQGNLKFDSYVLSGGTFKRETDVKENAEGDVEQAVSIYHLIFSNAPRAIG